MGAISQLENRGADTKIRFTAPHICIPAFCAQNALQMKSTLLFQVLYHPNAIRKPGSNLQIKTSFLQPPSVLMAKYLVYGKQARGKVKSLW